jgi:serine/threonine protein kinase/peptidoglycan hydrolase-like protein with peptidoglycan-binding domain
MAEDQGGKTQIRRETEHYAVLRPGISVGRYEIMSVLGQGGFGITYHAHDTQLDRDVAIKEYLPTSLAIRQGSTTVLPRSTEMADDFSWGRQRFLDEAKTLARLAHAPAVVRVFDYLEAHGTAYAVMQLVEGETLAALLKRETRLAQPVIERILHPLLEGLEQVHAAGFLHRDIKPANIIISRDGAPTLIDFGASRMAIADRSQAMTAVFTPGFAAIEQFTSGKQGPWTDIYALAATFYACVTGQPPPSAIDRVVDNELVPAARSGEGSYAPRLLAAIDAGLAVKASDRPQTIAEWRRLLAGDASTADGQIVDGQTIVMSRPLSDRPREAARARNWPKRLVFAVIALIVLASGGYFAVDRLNGGKPPAESVRTATATPAQSVPLSSPPSAVDEQAKRLAETEARLKQLEIAAKQQEEEHARSEAQARQRADEEKAMADQDAKVRAAAAQQQQAEADAKARADAGRKSDDEVKRTAEQDEAALNLSEKDRQKIQVALTSLGFNTGGADGSFGPRSRQMIAAWQQKDGAPATGFVSAAQNADLLRTSASALARWEADQKKLEDDKKQAADARQKAEDDAKSKAAVAATASPAAPVAPAAPAAGGAVAFDGTWNAMLSCTDYGDAKGFSEYMSMTVRNGFVEAIHGTPGRPGSLRIVGLIQPDGTAPLQASGLTGAATFSTGSIPPGSPVTYPLTARFNGTRGTAVRTQGRPCTLMFNKG